MKILKKLTIIILSVCISVPHLAVSAKANTNPTELLESSSLKENAEHLYEEINKFLLEYKDVLPEKFDDICKEYIAKDITTVNLLNEKDFQEKSKDNIILYRGLNEKYFADNLKKGIIYLPSNTKNVRGMGIYTTTSFFCAKHYSDKNNSETIVKMLIPKSGVKILENEYLERLKDIIRRTHPKEFGAFSKENKEKYIFDSMSKYINEQFNKVLEKIEKEKIDSPDEQQRLLDELGEQLKKDPTYQKLKATRKRYFKENKASVFYNSGLLTKLLGFDVLHSIDYLSNTVDYKEEEYLVINAKVVSILSI